MKTFKRAGFALAELLAVVLIIGVLAAAALPQYRKTVTKAQNREAVIAMRAIGQAIERYDLANGPLPEEQFNDFSVLDVQIPASKEWLYVFYCYDEFKSCVVSAWRQKNLKVGESSCWLNQWVDRGRLTPGVYVSKTTRMSDDEENMAITWTSEVDEKTCFWAGGRLDEEKGCVID